MKENFAKFKTKFFADGADLDAMIEMASKPFISGLTTNPTLMRKAGVENYVNFAKSALKEIKDKPISFEVFSDETKEMKVQAEEISSWGENVYVKIPVTNTRGESTREVIAYLTHKGIKINVTAIMTPAQVANVLPSLNPDIPSYISVFAGRIADTGRDPLPIMIQCLELAKENTKSELIWASPRELFNVIQAEEIGCHIITATNDILAKLTLIGHDLEAYSLETVQMFYKDAVSAGYTI
jgi:transaldolase